MYSPKSDMFFRTPIFSGGGFFSGASSKIISSISFSNSSFNLKPFRLKIFMPLSPNLLCDALITIPASYLNFRVKYATAGVGTTSAKKTSPPIEHTPAHIADSIIVPEIRVSRPIKTFIFSSLGLFLRADRTLAAALPTL